MAEITTVPFGPQHPVLPEPIHLDLELKDERVVRAVPSIGYVHRGLEKLVEKRDFKQFIYVAERVCGICSFGHGWGYAKAVEGLMDIEIPERASCLRTMWHELSRLHSHLLWFGLAADAMGFESLFMNAWRIREIVLDIFEETTGGPCHFLRLQNRRREKGYHRQPAQGNPGENEGTPEGNQSNGHGIPL